MASGVSREALAALDKLFPERSARLGETEAELFYKGGQRSVLRFIHALLEN